MGERGKLMKFICRLFNNTVSTYYLCTIIKNSNSEFAKELVMSCFKALLGHSLSDLEGNCFSHFRHCCVFNPNSSQRDYIEFNIFSLVFRKGCVIFDIGRCSPLII